MTMLKPTIFVNRLVVLKDGLTVLDIQFHLGVNIVSGHNSSGKTTVLDFLAYSLGGENIPWKQEALLCDSVMVEVALNGRAISLRRDVNQKPLNPMHIYWGNIAAAWKGSLTDWETYPFRRSSTKISFTQAILLALELAEAQGDGASNLTMHQFLRVIYADQPSLHNPIFRADSFDSVLTRETVGNYLCGIYDDALYAAQLERRTLEKDLNGLTAELRSIFSVFARSQQDFSLEFFNAQITSLEYDRDQLALELKRLKSERTVDRTAKSKEPSLRDQLDRAKREYFEQADRLTRAEFEIADSKKFIEEIRSRLESIDQSNAARNYFGSLNFSYCPCCLGEISRGDANANTCSLCKNAVVDGTNAAQLLRMKNELRIQLDESLKLLSESEVFAAEMRASLPSLKQNLRRLEKVYSNNVQVWTSDLEDAVENTARRIGEIEQKIAGLYELQKLALVIEELQARRTAVNDRFLDVDSLIEKLEFAQEERKRRVSSEISATLARLLKKDLDRQEEFKNPEKVEFSFADNSVAINGSKKFSESSTVVLRHLFHVALLSASVRIPMMRFPRLLILDGIEDGGLETIRAHLLQQIIVDECNTFESAYQLIFASSQIAPSLNSEQYVVGRTFSENDRSLAIMA